MKLNNLYSRKPEKDFGASGQNCGTLQSISVPATDGLPFSDKLSEFATDKNMPKKQAIHIFLWKIDLT